MVGSEFGAVALGNGHERPRGKEVRPGGHGARPLLAAQRFRDVDAREHVELRGHAEHQRCDERRAPGMRVGIDESGE